MNQNHIDYKDSMTMVFADLTPEESSISCIDAFGLKQEGE
jgi:hypothetical protein